MLFCFNCFVFDKFCTPGERRFMGGMALFLPPICDINNIKTINYEEQKTTLDLYVSLFVYGSDDIL